MRKLTEEEEAQLRAMIVEERNRQKQVVRETIRQNNALQAMRAVGGGGPIDKYDFLMISVLVFIFGNALLNGVFPELNWLWVGGFPILVVGAFACVIVENIIKSLKNRESERTRSATRSCSASPS